MLATLGLYIATILIWGSTWLAIHLQLGTVSPYWSVVYRFGIAAIILLSYCLLTRQRMRFSAKQHFAIFLQGLSMFSINYILYYLGSKYFISGLVSLTFAVILIFNIINSRIFFKTKLQLKIIVGSIIGLTGLTIVFSGQFSDVSSHNTQAVLEGLGLCIAATFIASLGNMITVRNQRHQLPILQSNAYGMGYGALIILLLALFLHEPIGFDTSLRYVGSLLYLAIVGSIVAFAFYMKLMQRIGPSKAAYAFVVLPIISLLISTIFESFQWSSNTFEGLALIIIGNILILIQRKQKLAEQAEVNREAG